MRNQIVGLDCKSLIPLYERSPLYERVMRLTISFRILITGEQSGLVETITDAVSVHSIKKGEYARRVAEGEAIGTVSLMDHFVAVCPPLTEQVELMVDIWETRFWAIRQGPAEFYQVPSGYVSSPHVRCILTGKDTRSSPTYSKSKTVIMEIS